MSTLVLLAPLILVGALVAGLFIFALAFGLVCFFLLLKTAVIIALILIAFGFSLLSRARRYRR